MQPIPAAFICALLGFCSSPANITDATMQPGSNMTANATTVAVKNHAKPPLNTAKSLVNAVVRPTLSDDDTTPWWTTFQHELHGVNVNRTRLDGFTWANQIKVDETQADAFDWIDPIRADAFDWIDLMVSVWASRAKAAGDSLPNDMRIVMFMLPIMFAYKLMFLITFAYKNYAECGIRKEYNSGDKEQTAIFLLRVLNAVLYNNVRVLQEEVSTSNIKLSLLRMSHNRHRELRAEPRDSRWAELLQDSEDMEQLLANLTDSVAISNTLLAGQ